MSHPPAKKTLKHHHKIKSLHENQELAHKLKAAAAQSDPAWANAGQHEGLQVWRIEHFTVKAWPQDKYGEFYGGDSYIVMKTIAKGGGDKSYDIHFWLGETTSQDEAGTAAYKTVELDDFLGGKPVQHREVQGFESERFQSYFPKGIHILAGGVDSGFHHVGPEKYAPRLLHLRGTLKLCTAIEVDLSRESLSSEDSFALDNGLVLFAWNGKGCSPGERLKAEQILDKLIHDRNGKPKKIVLEEGDETEEFWSVIGGKGPIAATSPHKVQAGEKRLLRLIDSGGKHSFEEVAKGANVKRDLLKHEEVFILDTGAEVFAWIGSKAPTHAHKNALIYAEHYLEEHGRPHGTSVAKVTEGHEHEDFVTAFH